MSANKLLAIDSLGEKISNNFQSGKQPLFGVAFPFINLNRESHTYIDTDFVFAWENWFRIEEQTEFTI